MPASTDTQILEVRRVWQQLPSTPDGALIQRVSGLPLQFIYSDSQPLPNAIGYIDSKDKALVPLKGGTIWVRSVGYTVFAFTPYDVDNSNVEVVAGRLEDLDTNTQASLVAAINELKALVDDLEANGGSGGSGGYVTEEYDLSITPTMIANRSLTLAHLPVGNKVFIGVYGGIDQRQNLDYYLDLNDRRIVRWDNLSLQLLFDTETVIRIRYLRT